jgi:hypothetical protein
MDPIGLAGGLNVYGFAGGDPINFSDPFGLCPQHITGRPCTTIHKVSTALGAGAGAMLGGVGGAVAGTVVLPVAGTLGGGAIGAVAGGAEGAVVGLAAANVAVQGAELLGATVNEMGSLGRRLRTFITTTILIPGGMASPVPTTPSIRGDNNPTTQEAEQQGRRPPKDDEPERPKQ